MKNQLLTPLREQIIKANEAYRKGSAIISDAEYDILIEELQLLNPDDELMTQHRENGYRSIPRVKDYYAKRKGWK